MHAVRPSALVSYLGGMLALGLCGCASLLPTQSTPSTEPLTPNPNALFAPPNYDLAFNDSFPGTSLDTSKWNYRTGVRLLSEQIPANIVVHSGTMSIDVGDQPGYNASWTGGGIISVNSFRYGYYQVDAKVTANPGWHTSFWVDAAGTSTQGTEIDDFEIDTQTPAVDSMGVHSWVNGIDMDPVRCNAGYSPAGYNSAAAMHSYGFEWTEDSIHYYVDGEIICTQQYPATMYTHSLVNIQLSSVGDAADQISVANYLPPNVFANVRYFVRDYYVNAFEPGYTTSGPWFTSELPGFSNLPTQASNASGASAHYTPTILTAGNYDVQVWKTQDANSDPATRITVNSSNGSIDILKDFTQGRSGWVDLGVYPFASGAAGSVVIGYSGAGYARASMVKFVRE